MALPAGRKGVLPSELTPEGKIKNSGSQYVLPIANASTLGGVKAVPKTEAMTQEVGVDSDGKLYVEPAQGGGVEIGSATLASGLTGYVNYLKTDELCIVTGEVKGLAANAYTMANLCTGLPCDFQTEVLSPLILGNNGGNSADRSAGELVISSAGAKLSVRNTALLANYVYTFMGVYLCGEVESSALTLIECTQESWINKVVSDNYVLIFGNFQPVNYSAGTPKVISAGLPEIEENILTAFISDGQTNYNYHNLYVDGTDLKINMQNTSSTRMDGALIYKIDKGGE